MTTTSDPAYRTLSDLIREHARARPGHAALSQGDERLDYATLDALMDRVAASLQRDGLVPGDAIAICAAASPRYAALFLGALRAGVAVAPLASSVTPEAFGSMRDDAQARGLFADASAPTDAADPTRIALDTDAPGRAFDAWLLPSFDAHDLASTHMKFCTSAPFHAALKADVVARWPGGLTEFYGMTEGGGTCILAAHEHPTKLETVGLPAEGHDIRLIDDAGVELPPGATGEVVGHSGGMMIGYHRQPAKTREAEWFDATGKRFIRTGDVGRFDADGFLMLLDRKKDMVISGGFNIYPSDLEAVLREHPAVADAAVVGVPSMQWGETPIAFVVPRDASAARESEVLEWVNARVGKTQRLAHLEFVAELPRSAIGKILKRELRERHIASGRAPH